MLHVGGDADTSFLCFRECRERETQEWAREEKRESDAPLSQPKDREGREGREGREREVERASERARGRDAAGGERERELAKGYRRGPVWARARRGG
jgi:hypothetical protein